MLSRKCAVNGCPATSKNKVMYDFPKTARLLEAWIEFCDRGKYWKPTKNTQLCSTHFTPSDIQTSTVASGVRRRTLRMNACPSVKVAPKLRVLCCAVANCRNNGKKSSDNVSYHRFPTDPDAKRKWVEFCGKNANWDPGRLDKICSEHFKKDELESSLIRNKVVHKLKDRVYPTINGPVKQSSPKKKLDDPEIKIETSDNDGSFKSDSPVKSPAPYPQNISAAKVANLIRRPFISPFETKSRSQEDLNRTASRAAAEDDDIVFKPEAIPSQRLNLARTATEAIQSTSSGGRRHKKLTDKKPNENYEQGNHLKATGPTNSSKYLKPAEKTNNAQVVDSEGLLEVMPNKRRRTISSFNSGGSRAKKKNTQKSDKKDATKTTELVLPDIARSFKRQSLPSDKHMQLLNTKTKSNDRDQDMLRKSRGMSMGRNDPQHKLVDNNISVKGADIALPRKISNVRESKKIRDGNYKTVKDVRNEKSIFVDAGSHPDVKTLSNASEKPIGDLQPNRKSKKTADPAVSRNIQASKKTPRKSLIDDKPSERNDDANEIILEISTSNSHVRGKSNQAMKSAREKSVVTEQRSFVKLPSLDYNNANVNLPKETLSRKTYDNGKGRVHDKGEANINSKNQTVNTSITSNNTLDSEISFVEPQSKLQEQTIVSLEGATDDENFMSGHEIDSTNSQDESPVKMLTFLEEDQPGGEIYVRQDNDTSNNLNSSAEMDEALQKETKYSCLDSSDVTFSEETISKVIEVSLHNKKIKKKIKVTLNRKSESRSGSTETLSRSDTLTANNVSKISISHNDNIQTSDKTEVASNIVGKLESNVDDMEPDALQPIPDPCELSHNIQEFINGTELPRETIIELGLGNQEAKESSGQISHLHGESIRHKTPIRERNTATPMSNSGKSREIDDFEEKRPEAREQSNGLLDKIDVDVSARISEGGFNKNPETSLERSYGKNKGKRNKGEKFKSHDRTEKKTLRSSPKKMEVQPKIYVKFSPEGRKSKKAAKNPINDTKHVKTSSDVRRRLSAKYVGRNDELLKSVASKITKSRITKKMFPKSQADEDSKPNNKQIENSHADSYDRPAMSSTEKLTTKVIEVSLPFKDSYSRKKIKVTLKQSQHSANNDEVSFPEGIKAQSIDAYTRSVGKKRTLEAEDESPLETTEPSAKCPKVSVSKQRKTVEIRKTSPVKKDTSKLNRAQSSKSEPECYGRTSPISGAAHSDSETISAVSPPLLQEHDAVKQGLSESADFPKNSSKSSNSSYSLPEWQMCEVTRCRNNSLKAIVGVIFHPLPLNHEKRNLWMEFCKPGDDWKPQEFSRVCSTHFKPEDYVNVKLHNHVKKVLKLDAIPSIYPGEVQSASVAGHNEIDNDFIKEEPNQEGQTDDISQRISIERDVNVEKVAENVSNEPMDDDNSESGSEGSRISDASYSEKSDNFSASSLSTEDSNCSSSGSSKLRKKVDEQKTLISTLYAAQNELKRNLQKQSESIKKLQKKNATAEQSNKELVEKIDEMKRSLKKQSSEKLSLSTQAFRSKIIDSPIGQALTENQIDLLLQVKKKVHWTNAELFSAFAIRCLSKEDFVYEFLKGTYPLPDISALQRYAQKIKLYGGLLNDVVDVMDMMGKMLSDKERATVLMYDSIEVQSTVEYDPDGDEVLGPYNRIHIIMARGLFSDWKQPIFIDFDKNLAVSTLNKVISKLHDIQFNVVALVCDSSQPKLNLLLGLGVSGKTTYFHHPRTDKKICCFFDPPRLLEMTRKALVTKGFTYTDGTEMTKEPLSRLRDSGPYIFPDGTIYAVDSMLDCVNPDMDSLSSAIELFSVTISSLLRKNLDNESLMLASFIDTVNKWFEIMSSLYLSGSEQLIVYFKDTDDQNAILNRTYDMIKSLRCIETNRINIFQEAILISIRSLQVLSKEMLEMYDEDTIFANKLSQNAMDIILDNIKTSCNQMLTPMNVLDKLRSIIFGSCEEVVKSESTLLLAEERFLTVMAFEEADLKAVVREKTLDELFFIKSKSSAWDSVVREIEDDGKLDVLTEFLIKKHRKQFCSSVDKVPPRYSMKGNSHGASSPINFENYSVRMRSICESLETFFKDINKEGTLSYKTKVLENLVNQVKGQVSIHREIVKSFLLQRILIRLRYLVLDMNIESGSCSDSDSF